MLDQHFGMLYLTSRSHMGGLRKNDPNGGFFSCVFLKFFTDFLLGLKVAYYNGLTQKKKKFFFDLNIYL